MGVTVRRSGMRAQGFTLLELIVTVAVMGILVGLAVPSLGSMIASQRAKSVASEMFASMMLARSEAIKRNLIVSVKAKSSAWANGWQVVDSANVVLDDRGAISSGVSVSAPVTTLDFLPSGQYRQGMYQAKLVVTAVVASKSSVRCVSLSSSGRAVQVEGSSC